MEENVIVEDKSPFIYAVAFILICVMGMAILAGRKSSIWFYLLLFIIIAPMLSTVATVTYIGITNEEKPLVV